MAINLKHSSTLYIDRFEPISRALELLLIKKEIIVRVTTDPIPAPDAKAPAFVHNNFLVFGPMNTLEFLIDFFPEPRAFPDDPCNRAIHRMLITEIFRDLYPLYSTDIEKLASKLNDIENALSDTTYFLNNSVYAIDCVLAPLVCKALSTTNLSSRLIAYASRLEAFFMDKRAAQEIYQTQQRAEQPSWT